MHEGEEGIHANATVASEFESSAYGFTTDSDVSPPTETIGDNAKVPSAVGNLRCKINLFRKYAMKRVITYIG